MSRKILSYDVETYEENLKKWGPGYHIGKGHIIGISFADDTGWSTYLPLAHPETTQQERAKNIAIAKEIFEEDCLHLAHNGLYDNVYLCNELGFKIPKKMHDTQYTMSLLDEYRGQEGGPGYTLDAVAFDLIGKRKEKGLIEQYCEERGWTGDPRKHLYKMPANVVAPYAKTDTTLLIPIYKIQMEKIYAEELNEIYEIENKLIPILTRMNKRGLKIDEEKRIELSAYLTREANKVKSELEREFGHCNYNSTPQLAKIFDSLSIPYPTTGTINKKTGEENPSIKNKYLEMLAMQGNTFAHKLVQWRKITKVRDTFVDGAFKDYQDKNGVIHSTLIPMAMDDAGTVSGRMACKNCNLQQVPSKDGEENLGDIPLGTLCRSIFVAEKDHWKASIDFSQLEFRMILNYACPPKKWQMEKQYYALTKYQGVSPERAQKAVKADYERARLVLEEMLDTFNTDRNSDFHNVVAKITDLPRGDSKAVSFGVAFYEGRDKLKNDHGWSDEKTDYVLSTYFDKLPFIKCSREAVVRVAEERGYIKTIGGRRARLAPYMKQGDYRDRKTYRMYNRLPQGSGADACKKAIVDAEEAGVYSEYDIEMQIHDEVLGEIPKTKIALEAFRELHRCMENAYKIKIPLLAEPAIGSSWGLTEERMKHKDGTKESIDEFFARFESMLKEVSPRKKISLQ